MRLRAGLHHPRQHGAACAVALIDRLTHHAEIISIEGESYRKREAEQAQKAKQTQKPQPSPKPKM